MQGLPQASMGTSTLVKLSIFFHQSEIWEGNYDSHTGVIFTFSEFKTKQTKNPKQTKKKTQITKLPKNPRDVNDLTQQGQI